MGIDWLASFVLQNDLSRHNFDCSYHERFIDQCKFTFMGNSPFEINFDVLPPPQKDSENRSKSRNWEQPPPGNEHWKDFASVHCHSQRTRTRLIWDILILDIDDLIGTLHIGGCRLHIFPSAQNIVHWHLKQMVLTKAKKKIITIKADATVKRKDILAWQCLKQTT